MHEPHEWSQLCSGVLLLNVPAMRAEYDALLRHARDRLGRPHHYDQETLNEHFEGRWDHLPIHMHWKPYWGVEWDAAIVHFHGPKAEDARLLAAARRATIYMDCSIRATRRAMRIFCASTTWPSAPFVAASESAPRRSRRCGSRRRRPPAAARCAAPGPACAD